MIGLVIAAVVLVSCAAVVLVLCARAPRAEAELSRLDRMDGRCGPADVLPGEPGRARQPERVA